MLTSECVKEVRQAEFSMPVSKGFYPAERRWHLRYERAGTVRLDCQGRTYSGPLVNLSTGGLLFRPATAPPRQATAIVVLQVQGYPTAIRAEVRVLRSNRKGVAAAFLKSPDKLRQCIPWMPNHKERARQ